MFVWIDTITGQKPNDLQSINGLNHYIGMKAIVPAAIPELRLMPGIIATLIGAGLVVAGIGRRGLLYAWTALLTVIAAAGLVDFWIWGYHYGHDLDPTAAIKIPGLSYQPPLLGSKQLLNFTAISWPSLGGWAIAAALTTGLVLCVLDTAGVRCRKRCGGRRDHAAVHDPTPGTNRRAPAGAGGLCVLGARAGGHSLRRRRVRPLPHDHFGSVVRRAARDAHRQGLSVR